jgi:hypothetical protein
MRLCRVGHFVLVDKTGVMCKQKRGRRGRDRMVVGFTIIYAIGAYHHYNDVSSNLARGGVYSIQHFVVKVVSDLRQVGGFLQDHHNIPKILMKVAINTTTT